MRLVSEAGVEVVVEQVIPGTDMDVQRISSMRLPERFRGMRRQTWRSDGRSWCCGKKLA
jgi:hypothetical protein